MGNTLGGSKKKTTKVMNVNGETTKLKTPIQAYEITKDHPGHVLLNSDSVKNYGIRAKPLDPSDLLEPKKIYFLVELPKFPQNNNHREPRRVKSGGLNMGARERLESLMISRRSVSDLSSMNPAGSVVVDEGSEGAVRVKMRLPKAEVERLVRESKDKAEAAEKLMDLYTRKLPSSDSGSGLGKPGLVEVPRVRREARREKSPLGGDRDGSYKKRVSFLQTNEAATQLVLAS